MVEAESGGPTEGGWVELTVQVDAESVDAVAEFLSRHAYNQGVVIQEPYRQDQDGDNWQVDPSRRPVVTAYFPAGQFDAELRQTVEQGLWHLGRLGEVGEPSTNRVEEEDWANSWKEFFPVSRIGRHFVVQPTWREYEARPGDVVIKLDPGMAFGTGLHPTTELCLRALEDLDLRDKRVLDAGAGSGILSVAAVKLGAREVDSLEIDPVAVSALGRNIELNELSDRIRVLQGDITKQPPSDRPYDVVVANILSRILIEAAPQLAHTTAPDGVLLLSGVIERHEAGVVQSFAALGFTLIERRAIGDWLVLTLRRRLG